jgi:hypothetical protein
MGLSNYNGFTGKEREASLRRVHKLWASGEVPKPVECLACFQREGTIHGHSEDYSNDHVHIPICITCHLILHMRFQMPKLWDQYREMIRLGWQGRPLEQRNALYRIKQLYIPDRRDEWPMEDVYEIRSGTVLDMICPIKFVHPNSPAAAMECLEFQQRLESDQDAKRGPNPFARP